MYKETQIPYDKCKEIDKDVELSETLKNKINLKSIVIAKNIIINSKEELDKFLQDMEENELEGAVITSHGFDT